jgi:pimeloyl-ACP methyl ester carboxylesterase
MSEYTIGPIEIAGHDGQPLPNRLFRNVGPVKGLAVLFPGLRYSCDMPLLFYPAQLFLQRGLDVLQVTTDYTQEAFASLPPNRQIDWLADDASAAVQAVQAQRAYQNLLLAGKSIGTLALSTLLLRHREYLQASTIWLTPLYRLPLLEQATQQLTGPALFISGSGDHAHDGNRLEHLRQVTGAEVLVIPQADHSLHIPGDMYQTLSAMQLVMEAIDSFLTRHGVA